ncbi:hypothetical protein VU11_05485 [Desulfobulbus sp. US2]|nr:hypothetical protein [Desulfobulbus sp. US4]MCW5208098.1 hypothetical protein [Desulfobulbus sp. US2]MCW5214769.1 hypothetical protein [Desulfobulbus sp. US5]WLE98720.1 MAG: hypothetical protein QTN59_07725 [Candidatus Electrothrix communis]
MRTRSIIGAGSTGIAAVGLLLAAALFVLPQKAVAKSKVVPVKGASYNVKVRFKDNLKTFIGKSISVFLVSGKSVTGTVKDVGEDLLHLEQLEGKSYFDALIMLDQVEAIETRFRMIDR